MVSGSLTKSVISLKISSPHGVFLFEVFFNQYHIFLVWLVTFLVIALYGYYNSRYQLTLLPFTAAAV